MRFKTALMSGVILMTRSMMSGELPKKCYAKISHLEYDVSDVERATIGINFDLNDTNCSKILIKKLCRQEPQEQGENAPHAVLETLLRGQPENVFEWILDHFQEFNGDGRGSIAVALRCVKYQESYKMIHLLLTDKADIVNKRAAVLAPSHYWNIRVCDLAYESLVPALRKEEAFAPDVPTALYSSVPLEERDKSIKRLRDWWAQSSESVIQNMRALAGNRPSIGNKMWAFERERK